MCLVTFYILPSSHVGGWNLGIVPSVYCLSSIVYFCFASVRLYCLMAQALVDLTYYKCGHCQHNFNSLAAFGKHQKEVHTPKNAPKNKVKEEEEKPTCLDFVLKVKLCQQCARCVRLHNSKRTLEVPLCPTCQQRNGFA